MGFFRNESDNASPARPRLNAQNIYPASVGFSPEFIPSGGPPLFGQPIH